MSRVPPFHLAVPVHDLAAARRFYGELLECPLGRSAERWIDFNFFGHQLSIHLVEGQDECIARNEVDGEQVPARHFGVVLSVQRWLGLRERLKAQEQDFLIEPQCRFQGLPGEQYTMFLLDPSGNALEFKAFADPAQLFAAE
ncbi:MAG: glyoxalase [Rickettsiales bacterium]|nr:glyoxalase [Rickettsiales bacterium]